MSALTPAPERDAVIGRIGLPKPTLPPPAYPIWSCRQSTPCCRHGHPLVWVKEAKGHGLHMSVGGYLLQFCRQCDPVTFSFGIANRDLGTTTWYDITRDQYDQLMAIDLNADPLDILRFLGYSQYGAEQR